MDSETKMRLKPILLRSKLGQFVSQDDQAFARKCWREFPKEYSALQTEEVIPEAAKFAPPTPPRDYQARYQGKPPSAVRGEHSRRPARTPRAPSRRGKG